MDMGGKADVVLVMTCAVRDGAEQKIRWRLQKFEREKRRKDRRGQRLTVGVLVNVMLSQEETYADIAPVRVSSDSVTAFVSVMRGCDNMCSYCIVPFTRGRERSRPIDTILGEVQKLSDEVLDIIGERGNICKQLHLPAQSGNSDILNAMGRGYTRESYLHLVEKIRKKLGSDVCLTSDFIAGFCGETESAHYDSLSLIRQVKYDFCYCFPFSLREKTRAHRRLTDDVPECTKKQRASELVETFRDEALGLHRNLVASHQLILVEGESKRSDRDVAGRTDGGTKVIVEQTSQTLNVGDYVIVKVR